MDRTRRHGTAPPATPAQRTSIGGASARVSATRSVAPRPPTQRAIASPDSPEAEHEDGVVGEVGATSSGQHRIFSVDRPTSTSMIVMIQKRTTTWFSFHPDSSKWWCSGAMRKMRLPPVHLK
jgi:hypothetical protein